MKITKNITHHLKDAHQNGVSTLKSYCEEEINFRLGHIPSEMNMTRYPLINGFLDGIRGIFLSSNNGDKIP